VLPHDWRPRHDRSGCPRGLFWVCVLDIVGNAVAQTISAHEYVLAFFAAGFFPATYLLYPFLQPATGDAWPWAAGHTLIPVLVLSVIAYPVSTIVGGLRPVE
jgi:hypothetical protein